MQHAGEQQHDLRWPERVDTFVGVLLLVHATHDAVEALQDFAEGLGRRGSTESQGSQRRGCDSAFQLDLLARVSAPNLELIEGAELQHCDILPIRLVPQRRRVTPMSKQTIDWNARRNYLGGSDMPSIMQIPGAYGTPLSVYLEKVADPQSVESREATYSQERGNALEAFLLQQFEKRTGLRVRTDECPVERPIGLPKWWGGNIDAWTTVDGVVVPVEAKSAGRFSLAEWGPDGTDQVPLCYMVQVMHYAELLGRAPFGYVVSDIAGDEARVYTVPRADAVVAKMRHDGDAFWDQITLRIPPDPTTPQEAAIVWPKAAIGKTLEADQELLGMAAALREAKAAGLEAEKRIDALKLAIQQRLGDAEALMSGGRKLVTWSNVKSTRVDLEALRLAHPEIAEKFTVRGTTRRFEIKKEKA